MRESCHNIDQAKNKLMLRSKELDHQMNKHQHDTKEAARRVGGGGAGLLVSLSCAFARLRYWPINMSGSTVISICLDNPILPMISPVLIHVRQLRS